MFKYKYFKSNANQRLKWILKCEEDSIRFYSFSFFQFLWCLTVWGHAKNKYNQGLDWATCKYKQVLFLWSCIQTYKTIKLLKYCLQSAGGEIKE